MTAATLLEKNNEGEIHLFEKNKELGNKVSISGGGRCNVTTGITDKRQLLSKYIRGSQFLTPSLSAFPPSRVKEWFEDHGVPLKIEEDMRVFPVSDIGKDVVSMFEKLFDTPRMHIHYTEAVTDIKSVNDKFEISTTKSQYTFDATVLTTGGNAYAHTGSTGDGYAFAKELGHSVTELGPSLNSFMAKEQFCKELSGIDFQEARFEVILSTGEKKIVEGPMIFTHFGISGPAVFALAAHVAFEKISAVQPLKVKFLPIKTEHFDSWDKKLQEQIKANGLKFIVNILNEYMPNRFATKILELANIPPDRKAADINKEERRQIAHLLSGKLEITLTMRRPGDEFVTAGGVKLEEVDRKTMRSKFNPNLYFAGEILDIDGLTGGFNLQASWATGRMAGINI
jgi:predicted Rossmann fold flavoprotein